MFFSSWAPSESFRYSPNKSWRLEENTNWVASGLQMGDRVNGGVERKSLGVIALQFVRPDIRVQATHIGLVYGHRFSIRRQEYVAIHIGLAHRTHRIPFTVEPHKL